MNSDRFVKKLLHKLVVGSLASGALASAFMAGRVTSPGQNYTIPPTTHTVYGESIKKTGNKSPQFIGFGQKTSSTPNGVVFFKDDIPVEMKAFVIYRGEEISLEEYGYLGDNELSVFSLPEGIQSRDNFEVYVIDRDGNKSKTHKGYTFAGALFSKDPRNF